MKVLVAVPCMDSVSTVFMQCLIDLLEETGGHEVYRVFTRSSLIYSSRNRMAEKAVENGIDRVLWLDSDMVFPADLLLRLMEDMDQGLDYVSGLYFSRKLPTTPVIFGDVLYNVQKDGNVLTGAESMDDYPMDSLFEIGASGFGAVMTSGRMLKDLFDKYGAPFTPLMGLGEDMAFCYRAKKEGFRLYCDSRIKCGHAGTYVFGEEDYLKLRTKTEKT